MPKLLLPEHFPLSFPKKRDYCTANYQMGCTIPTRENYGRRYSVNMQRLRAGFHIYGCRSIVLFRTRVLDPEALQSLPHGQEERPRSRGFRLPFGSVTGNSCDLFGLRTANYSAF